MPITTFDQAPDQTTDANFRLWGLALRAALLAVNWIRTADTGQIDWTTVLAPVANYTFQGYEIWRMNDALQGTTPLFMKLEYGSDNNAARPALRVSFASSTDGAGNLTGVVYLTPTLFGCGQNNATLFRSYVTGDANRLAFMLFRGTAGGQFSYPVLLTIERSKNQSGGDSASGFQLALFSWDNAVVQFLKAANPQTTSTDRELVAANGTNSGIDGNVTGFTTPVYFSPAPQQPGLDMFGTCNNSDIAEFTTLVMNVYGGPHTFIALDFAPGSVFSNGAAMCIILWE